MFYHITSKAIAYECGDICEIDIEEELELLNKQPDKHLIVPTLECPLCKVSMRYDNMLDLEKHLKAYHKRSRHFQCKKCGQTIALNFMRGHYEACLKIGMFQCVHCCYGSDMAFKVRMHLVDKHPSEISVCCYRDSSAVSQKLEIEKLKLIFWF